LKKAVDLGKQRKWATEDNQAASTNLKVPKVLFPQPRILSHPDDLLPGQLHSDFETAQPARDPKGGKGAAAVQLRRGINGNIKESYSRKR